MNQTHERWKQIYIRDQWNFGELSDYLKHECYRCGDNDMAIVACIGA